MQPRFSQLVLDLLASAGWREQRKVPLAGILEFLGTHGYKVPSCAESFLEEFHGLTLKSETCFVVFDVRQAQGGIDSDDVSHLESLVGEAPCVIGYGGYGTFFMTPSGKVVHCAIDWVGMYELDDYTAMFEALSGANSSLIKPVSLSESQLPPYLLEDRRKERGLGPGGPP